MRLCHSPFCYNAGNRMGIFYNPGQKCWDTCTFSLKIAPLRFPPPPPPSPSHCCISGLKVHFFGATLTRGEGGRHFAQTRPSRASKTERLANTCHIFRLSQGLLSRVVVIEKYKSVVIFAKEKGGHVYFRAAYIHLFWSLVTYANITRRDAACLPPRSG